MKDSNLATAEVPLNLDGRMALFETSGGDVFSKAYALAEPDLLRDVNLYPYYQKLDRNDGATAVIAGREVIMLGSNNYLGLTVHPEVRRAAVRAVENYGTSLTGSRLLNGTHALHESLEDDLADFVGKEAALVFTTGYQANLGVISALMTRDSVLVIDKGDHASVYDGARLGKARTVGFRHNDVADLERVLSEIPSGTATLVLVDGVFSMEGDLAPLDKICATTKKFGARIAVDDAHGFGVTGKGGRGTSDHFGVSDKVDLVIGTFSKTFASVGGFAAGEAKVIDFIRHFGRSILFSASLPPASAAAAQAALAILKREPERVDRLNANARYLRDGFKSLGFDTGASETPVIPVIIGDEVLNLTLWKELLDAGVYVNAILYPAVPREKALLRTSCISEHTREQLDRALEAFGRAKRKLGI